jgi:2-dehydro-3-deoxygalactonokinase
MVGSAQGLDRSTLRARAGRRADARRARRARAERPRTGCSRRAGRLFDRRIDARRHRGEEIKIAGAVAASRRSASVRGSPAGTLQWAFVREKRIVSFATYMTGELYAVLREHSILGRLMSPEPADAGDSALGFEAGLAAARASSPGDLGHQLFAARTLGLTGRLPRNGLADYLSGLLVGHELVSGLAASRTAREAGAPLVLVGDAALCERYARALETFDTPVHAQLENTAPRGLWEFARAAGLTV